MTKDELVEWVKDDITIGGSLDINLPDKEIRRIIDQSVDEIYELYPDSLQEGFIIIHNSVFKHKEFKANRMLEFPDCVKSVIELSDMNRNFGLWGFGDRDFCFEKYFMADSFYGGGLINSDVIMSRTISYSAFNQLRSFTLTSIQFDYNRNTHKLFFKGHDPKNNVLVRLMSTIPDKDLFNDPWVKRYILARCKQRVSRMLGTFTSNLIGGVQINANIYSEEAGQDLDKVLEYWKSMTTAASWIVDFC